MNSLTVSRCALSVCGAVTLLVGCGGLQPAGVTQGPVPQGQMPENPSRVTGVRQSPRSLRHATEKVLYSFNASSTKIDGSNPAAGLTYLKGTLYGTTEEGGAVSCRDIGDCGTVFSITPSGTEKLLHSFKGGNDGASPEARLIVRDGTLYGTTVLRGGCRQGVQGTDGCGTVFSITPSGHETALHGFAGSPDGSQPHAALHNVNGTLYGTTQFGGSYCPSGVTAGCGTVFSVTTTGKETVLHSFGNGTDGKVSFADLIDVNGTLYGTTAGGGTNSCASDGGPCGTVFSITPGGAEKVLHNFAGSPSDGSDPQAGLTNVGGTLYGTTCRGGANGYGTVYKITTSGTESVLYSFAGPPSDGSCPVAGLTNVGSTLYGTTCNGGANASSTYYGCLSKGDGTVFKITISGTESVLHSFAGPPSDGLNPLGGLTNVGGTLYGTTFYGGDCGRTGCGTVFSIVP